MSMAGGGAGTGRLRRRGRDRDPRAVALVDPARRRWSGSLSGFGLYLLLPPRYQSTTTILVEPQEVPQSYVESTVTLEIEQRLNTLQERVTSHSNLTQLIELVGAKRLDPSGRLGTDEILAMIRRQLAVDDSSPRREDRTGLRHRLHARGSHRRRRRGARHHGPLHRREPEGPRAAGHGDGRVPGPGAPAPARRGQQAGGADPRVPDGEDGRPALAARHQPALARPPEPRARGQSGGAGGGRPSGSRCCASSAPTCAVGTSPSAPSTLSSVLNAARQELLQAQRVYTDEHPNVRRLREEVARLEAELRASEGGRRRSRFLVDRPGAGGARQRGVGGQPRDRGSAPPGGPDPPGDRAAPGARRGDAAARAGGARAHARLREPDGDLPRPAHQEVRGLARAQPRAGPEGRALQGAAPGQRAEDALLARSSHPAAGGSRRRPAAGRPAGRRRRVPPSGLPLGRAPDADRSGCRSSPRSRASTTIGSTRPRRRATSIRSSWCTRRRSRRPRSSTAASCRSSWRRRAAA